MTTCTARVLPSAAIATLMLHFVLQGNDPGYDCTLRKAVYSLSKKERGGCAVYTLMSPEQRARLTPEINTHDACPANQLSEHGVLSPEDFFEQEGKVDYYGAEAFLLDLQVAHDQACNIAVGFGLCNPERRAFAVLRFQEALEGGLRSAAERWGLEWASIQDAINRQFAALQPA